MTGNTYTCTQTCKVRMYKKLPIKMVKIFAETQFKIKNLMALSVF